VATTPAERLERLRRHAVAGFARSCADASVRERARRWLAAHPSAMADVDALWLRALDRDGPLAAWFDEGAEISRWQSPVPLHSVLACHPFPDLPQWTEVTK
jgi:hypothetical protein